MWPGWLIHSRNVFLIIMEARKSKIKALAESVSGEAHFPVHRQLSSYCVRTWRKGPGISLGFPV